MSRGPRGGGGGNNEGQGRFEIGEGSHIHPCKNHMYGRTPGPNMPRFTKDPEQERGIDAFTKLIRSFTYGVDEYEALDPRVEGILTFVDYCHLKEKYRVVVGTSK